MTECIFNPVQKNLKLFNGITEQINFDGNLPLIVEDDLKIFVKYINNAMNIEIHDQNKNLISKSPQSEVFINFEIVKLKPGRVWNREKDDLAISKLDDGNIKFELLAANVEVNTGDNKTSVHATDENALVNGGLCALTDFKQNTLSDFINDKHDLVYPMCQSKLQEAEKMCNAVLNNDIFKYKCTFKETTTKKCLNFACYLSERGKNYDEIKIKIFDRIMPDCTFYCEEDERTPYELLYDVYGINLTVDHLCINQTDAPSTYLPSTTTPLPPTASTWTEGEIIIVGIIVIGVIIFICLIVYFILKFCIKRNTNQANDEVQFNNVQNTLNDSLKNDNQGYDPIYRSSIESNGN